MPYTITVRDQCAPRGVYVEEWDCKTKEEADGWVKQFKAEYPNDCGYIIKVAKEGK